MGATYFRGSKPIDGIWATSEISVFNASIMPAGYGIGDHRLIVIDFASADVISTTTPKVIRPAFRRLNTIIPKAAAEYARILEKKITAHRLIERIGKAYRKSKSKRTLTCQINKLDKELGQYMRFVEKHCRKIKSGYIPFSPESSLWICQVQVYRSLLRWHAGRIRNHGNLRQSARC